VFQLLIKTLKNTKDRLELNASAGISVNKFYAKLASHINKPNGQKTIPPEEVLAFENLDIRSSISFNTILLLKMHLYLSVSL
jgi:DNA polymerase-4